MAVDHYTRIMGDIQALFRSRLQIQILLALAEENRTLAELRDVTGSSSQALIPKIRKLESGNFMEISEYEYHLTPIGRILTMKIQDIILYKSVTKKHKVFFDEHFVESIPEAFLQDLGSLYHSEMISDTNVDIFNVYFNFLKAIGDAEEVYILSPISSPAHTDAVLKRIRDGIYIETLVGRNLLAQLSASSHYDRIRELASHTSSKILVLDDMPRLGLTVTDKCISLGLYKNDGVTYDTTTDLFSMDPRAVAWGMRLYRHYRDQAEELQLE